MLDILKDWLGEGGQIVDRDVAEKRAGICSKCKFNTAGEWWEKFSKDPIAEIIKKTLELKNGMRIGVPQEKNLFMCKPCGCACRLKVHVPIEHIRRHTSESTKSQFPDWCWIIKEINQ